MHWGHVTSSDFLTWKELPIALAPQTPGADEKGCFSGTAFEEDGKHIIAYTGVTQIEGKDIQNQCIAIGNGSTYTKLKENPVITESNIPFSYNREHFRDPKIWKKDDLYYMACVIKQIDDKGALILFSSSDLKSWTYNGMLDSSKDGLSNMWECPDLFTLNDRDIFVLSPQEMKDDFERGFHNGNNSLYITGILDYKNCRFIRDSRPENNYTAAQIDYGIDFYAPETTLLPDGRRIMIGWMQAWESYITPLDSSWSGMMTLPRELSLKNNRLYQQPVRELLQWRKDKIERSVPVDKRFSYAENLERHFELQFRVCDGGGGLIEIILGNIESEYVSVVLDLENRTISFDRSRSLTPGDISSRKAKLTFGDSSFNVQIIADTFSMEVFLNDGIQTFTNSFFMQQEKSNLIIKNTTSSEIKCTYWNLHP